MLNLFFPSFIARYYVKNEILNVEKPYFIESWIKGGINYEILTSILSQNESNDKQEWIKVTQISL